MERQAEQAATAVQMAADLGLEASTLGSFYQFADRDSPADLPQESVGPLSDMGLVETGDDGKPRITSAGRSFLDAARNGDEARARDALSRGGERTRTKAAREAAAAEREAEAEEKKKSGGGGGGGSAKPDKEAEARAKAQKERAKNRQLMAEFRDDPDSLTINERRRLEQAGLLEQVDGRWQAATKADAPAPPEDRIRGSAVNKPGSAAGAGSGRDIEITEAVETALRNKMEAHNEAHDEPGKRATMGMLRSVWRRGAGAFSVSHRPGMTRQQWAMARVNSFLTLLRRGRPENARYVTDNDLLPEDHPKSTRRDGQKAAESYVPPASVRAAARRALEVREEAAPSNRGMTPVGLARARDLSNGRPVSVETLRRMKAYFDRHEIDKQGSTWGERGKGWQAWYGWGGDAGRSWANGILRSVDAEDGQKQSAQQRAIHAKLGGSGGGGGGGGGGGSASGGAAGGGAAVTQQWATGKDGKRHPTEEQKTARVAALSDKRDQLRQKAAAAPEGSRQRAAAERAVAKVDGKIRDTEKRPTLDQVNTSVQQRRSERLQTQADRARRAADSGQMTESQARRARMRAENLEARAKGQPVPNKRTSAKPKTSETSVAAPAVDADGVRPEFRKEYNARVEQSLRDVRAVRQSKLDTVLKEKKTIDKKITTAKQKVTSLDNELANAFTKRKEYEDKYKEALRNNDKSDMAYYDGLYEKYDKLINKTSNQRTNAEKKVRELERRRDSGIDKDIALFQQKVAEADSILEKGVENVDRVPGWPSVRVAQEAHDFRMQVSQELDVIRKRHTQIVDQYDDNAYRLLRGTTEEAKAFAAVERATDPVEREKLLVVAQSIEKNNDKLRDKRDELREKRREADAEYRAATDELGDRIVSTLSSLQDKPNEQVFDISSDFKGDYRVFVEKETNITNNTLSSKLKIEDIRVATAIGNFGADGLYQEANTRRDKPRVVVNERVMKKPEDRDRFEQVVIHEFAHAWDDAPGVYEQTSSWLERRILGEERKTSGDFGLYGAGWYDKFINAYIGADVPTRHTEVTSMGWELMRRKSHTFMSQDPDHFDLIWSLARGDF
jgi:hypothetical protein